MVGFLQNLFSGKSTAENETPMKSQTPLDMARTVNKIAFRASKSNQSETYYKPTREEAEAAKRVTEAAMRSLKEQGIDRRSVKAKDAYAKAVAAYAQTTEGRNDLALLQNAESRAVAFEKPAEKSTAPKTAPQNAAEKTENVVSEQTAEQVAQQQRGEALRQPQEEVVRQAQSQPVQRPKTERRSEQRTGSGRRLASAGIVA